MGSTYTGFHYHIVFGTKERRPFLRPEWRPLMHEYLGGTVRGLDGIARSVGGVEDHVHLLVGLKPTHQVSYFMCELKKSSSVWAKATHDPEFEWQKGYSAFTVSPTHVEAVRAYIERQEEHHRQVGFVEELRAILEKNGVAYDPRWLV